MCIKDSQGISKSHDPITVDYAIVGGNLLFSLHAKKKNRQDKKQFQSRKKKHKTKKTGFLGIYTCREGLKKCIFFYYSSDLSLAPHAELSNIFPKSVLF